MARYPDRRSAALPALAAAQRVHGWCSPEAIEQVACVMRLTPAYLSSVATFYDMFELEPVGRHSVYVCTNISCSLRGADELYARDRGRRRRRSRDQPALVRVPRRLRHRADGLRRPGLLRPAGAGRRAAPGRGPAVPAATRSPSSPWRCGAPRIRARTAHEPGDPLQGHRRAGARDARGLRAPRRLPGAAQGAGDGPGRGRRRARRLRAARPRRRRLPRPGARRPSCRRATWTSTWSATPTSPSRAPSRTAS